MGPPGEEERRFDGPGALGLRALLVARRLAGGSSQSLVLRNPSDAVLATLALAGLGDAFLVA